MIDIVCVMYLL